jgi:diguanylate cyclase (GGDEF)-like protein
MDQGKQSTINFGHRIDAFRMALQALNSDPESATTIRRMAATLCASCKLNNLEELAIFTNEVQNASPENLPGHTRTLITRMRVELAKQEPRHLAVLLVSCDPVLRESLNNAFQANGHHVFICESTSAARQQLRQNSPSLLVVDSVLAGEEGLVLIHELRSNPSTAAMPIIAILPQGATLNATPSLVHDADAYFNKPVDSTEVADFIATHLKRRFELGRPSRRDPLSGLMNRAAFIETCESLQASATQKDEPLSVALIGLCGFNLISQSSDQETIDDLIRHIGSILSSSFRATDVVARWGVAEFAVNLPGEDYFGITSALEKVLQQINRQQVTQPSGKPLPLKACAGFAMLQPSDSFADVAAKVEGYLFQASFRTSGNSSAISIVSDAVPSIHQSGRIALCVGDATLERVITQMIEKDRIEVVALPAVEDAVERLTQSPFNMLIVDDSLPDDGAVRLVKAVRECPKLSRFHILILASSEESVTRTLELGVSDYALKPISAATFMARLRRGLSQHDQSRVSNSFNVMIVDQSIPQLLIAGTVLFQQTGCSVVLAHGFQDALTRYRDRPPNCMILDCDIPEVALKDFSDRLAVLPDFANVQVIAACEHPGGSTPSSLNIKGHVSRPYKPSAFLAQIKGIITLPAPEASAIDRPPIDGEIQRVLSRTR